MEESETEEGNGASPRDLDRELIDRVFAEIVDENGQFKDVHPKDEKASAPADGDETNYEIIRDPVRLTAYDRRRRDVRALEDQRDQVLAQPESEVRKKHLVSIEAKIALAQKRVKREHEKSLDDSWRRRQNIDAWRAGEGQPIYNSGRRKVRVKPNTERSVLAAMTEEERKQHDNDRKSDAKWLKRRKTEGMSEADIAAAYEKRCLVRARERGG